MSDPQEPYRPITLGESRVPGNIFLAPMAGYTDAAFRAVAVQWGADCTYTELISAEGLTRGGRNTISLLQRHPLETHWAVQIFTVSPHAAFKAVGTLLSVASPILIDLNCGCPVPKVVRTGAGAALLKDPSLIYMIVKAMKEATSLPITVKIRSGWDEGSLNYRETAQAAVEGGASMVCLHPRTRAQGYGGRSQWEHIRDLKEFLSVPVFGSGDLFTAEDVLRMFQTTRCDGVMIARGAVGNPFIFRQTKALLRGRPLPPPTPKERLETARRHLDLAIQAHGENRACRELRKHLIAYVKGMPGSAAFRSRIVSAETRQEYDFLIQEYERYLSS